MKLTTHLLVKALCRIGLLACIALPATSWAALTPFQSFSGNVAVSTDGLGISGVAGTISASVPVGSTVLAAYLYSATHGSNATPTVTLNGSTVAFGPRVGNGTACCNLASFRADVTSIVKPVIDGGPGGITNFSVNEVSASSSIDGEALVVIYQNAALPDATVGILDGFASVTGDTTSINFSAPLNPSDPGFFAELSLGISFSCCNQKSTVKVNGSVLTTNAGNNDDGVGSTSNGQLITVGGFDDPFSPVNPTYTADHEHYDLSSFITLGDTSIAVDTINGSKDDNIFLASFYVSGNAGFNEPPPDPDPTPDPGPTPVPEPGTLTLTILGLLGILVGRGRSRRRISA